MDNKLAQNFTLRSLLSFTAPTCIMMVFMAVYQMTDAVFVSNCVGPLALSALNIVFPIPSIIIALSIMLSTGGSAVIARNMGQGKTGEARENFSMLIWAGALVGIVVAIAGTVWIEPLVRLLGATDALYPYCRDYLLILTLSAPLSMLQMLFQTFFVTAGRPHLGLGLTVLGGVTNIALDALFVAALGWG